MNDKLKIPKRVLEEIENVRDSGVINMLDVYGVASVIASKGISEVADWIEDHKKEYATLIFQGPEAFEIIDEEVIS